jgi:hypothetical protein
MKSCIPHVLAVATAITTLGCASATVPPTRFANADPVKIVDDRRDVAKRPAKREHSVSLTAFDGIFFRQITRASELPQAKRALGVNAMDEVPDSTWFTNRIGVRDLTLDEVRAGATVLGSPEAYKPWTILSAKVGGKSVGFIVADNRGKKFQLKFDARGLPEVETTAQIVGGKLLWASGYSIPEDHIVYITKADLVIGKDAKLTPTELDRALALIEIDPDGRIRTMTSWMLDGKALGGHPQRGTRDDDPNDRIPHERRRDLRGMAGFFAWIDHIDVKESQTIDMWIEDSSNKSHHYVKHYLVDFGKSFGVLATSNGDKRRGHQRVVDFGSIATSFVTVGLNHRPWEARTSPKLRGVALLESRDYNPGTWKIAAPVYLPLETSDRLDKFWASKILMRFTREQIRAIVETAKLTDPRAVDYMTQEIVNRQRITARYWFEQVNPLDRFTLLSTGAVCFDDLLLSYRLAPVAQQTYYAVTAYDHDGRQLAPAVSVRPDAKGHACTGAPMSTTKDGYTIVKITTSRPGSELVTFVHVAQTPGTNAPRVIGVWRQ